MSWQRLAPGEKERAFLESALATEGTHSQKAILEWLQDRRNAHHFSVTKVPLAGLQGWHIDPETGDLAHQSGKFFRVEGLEVSTNFGPTGRWMQPIINQPEIGILGFLVQRIHGVYHFLIQAKMEPGNINLLQLSPTVQATRSNYTQVHGGARPRYLDYFLDRSRARVLVDQLQSEQGARFLRKRNRNIIVEVPEGEPVEPHQDFCWMTLGQINGLLTVNNIVNMDSRTVLSCIRYASSGPSGANHVQQPVDAGFREHSLYSAVADDSHAEHDFDELISWITHLKTDFDLNVRRVPLNKLDGWIVDEESVRHRTGRYFKVIGVDVTATSREVASWQQPLIESVPGGVLAFVCQKRRGLLHFLVQGRVEPGNFDGVELAPTVQCNVNNYDTGRPDLLPPFYSIVEQADRYTIWFDAIHSEEGGRFYHDENRYLIVEIGEDVNLTLPHNYTWMTIRQLKEFIRFNNYLNIEARGLLAFLINACNMMSLYM